MNDKYFTLVTVYLFIYHEFIHKVHMKKIRKNNITKLQKKKKHIHITYA